jgi:hypothetical protein
MISLRAGEIDIPLHWVSSHKCHTQPVAHVDALLAANEHSIH